MSKPTRVTTCGICLSTADEACALGACPHTFCQRCIMEWCAAELRNKGDAALPSCPTCRAPVLCISKVNGADTQHLDAESSVRRLRVAHPSGLTVARVKGALVVKAVAAKDGAAAAGIAPGARILAINGRVAFSHCVAIQLFERFGEAAGAVEFVVACPGTKKRL